MFNVGYQLPSYAQTMPWSDNGVESFTFYIISRSSVTTDVSGENLFTHKPKVAYVDHFGEMKTDMGDEKTVYAHGPVIKIEPRVDEITTDSGTRDYLVAGALNTVHATIYVSNVGDDIAQDVKVTAKIPQTVSFQTSSPAPDSSVERTFEWNVGDIAPYSQATISLTLQAVTPSVNYTGSKPFTLIETIQPELMHMFLQRQVTGAV